MTVTTLSRVPSSPALQLALQTKLQSDSEDVPRIILPPSIYCVPDKARRHMEISREIQISSPNRDIKKIIAFSGSSMCRQNVHQGQRSRIPYLPL
ncbi:hypothetical protein AVEN_261688-1 [Araneus ventricosus]|uniref:Uncharacterized protein n=1 Tax=Araneus ventricosus TaxID=182803 RepID=A0A4Y2DUL3_ARAVE|nr:hypothetical protein AVEN_261688-1 [Araneus ventricosus]